MNITNARTWFKRPRKPLVDVFPQYLFFENTSNSENLIQ